MKNFTSAVLFIIGCELVGLASTPITTAAIPTWYAGLNKPFFNPPNWIFAPVWTTLYFLMGLAAYLVWKKGINHKKVKTALILFCIQLASNFLWSVLFFGLHSPLLGLIDIVLLIGTLLLTIIAFNNVSRTAAALLLPYLAWTIFAGVLTASIFVLN